MVLRVATKEEKDYYEQFLYPFQDEILKMIQTPKFYLTGGTCLSRYYYQHRLSEDLDFFFDGKNYPADNFNWEYKQIIQRIAEQFTVEINVEADTFKRIFAIKNGERLKIEFIYENFPTVGEVTWQDGFRIDNTLNVATNKITAIYDRKTSKDFFDLYYLLQKYELTLLSEKALLKMMPLDYEGTQLALAFQQLEGQVRMLKEVTEDDFNQFVYQLIQKLLQNARQVS
jgi:predicted nucleotidyltransferase component of viral defense system